MLNILADALLIALRASPAPTARDRFPTRPTETRWTKQNSERF